MAWQDYFQGTYDYLKETGLKNFRQSEGGNLVAFNGASPAVSLPGHWDTPAKSAAVWPCLTQKMKESSIKPLASITASLAGKPASYEVRQDPTTQKHYPGPLLKQYYNAAAMAALGIDFNDFDSVVELGEPPISFCLLHTLSGAIN